MSRKVRTSHMMVYGELRRFPISIFIKKDFWGFGKVLYI